MKKNTFVLQNEVNGTHTSIVREGPVGDELPGLQPVHQRPHPPRAPEKRVPPGAQRAQLLHAPLFGTTVLEPNLDTQTHTYTGHFMSLGKRAKGR